MYLDILKSYLKRSELIKNNKGKIIDVTQAFKYAQEKGKYNMLNNKFDRYIRNIITKELI